MLFVGLGFLGSSTASAETGSDRHTSWGVQTKGASSTIGRWKALTWAVEQVGNTMFVGGNFLEVTNGSQVGDQPYLAAFDADTGRWQSWFSPNAGNAVFALEASPDGALFVGGEMGTWNGSQIGALQKIDPATGEAWPGWNVRAFGGGSVVRDLKIEPDGWLYVVGNFTTASSNGASYPVNGVFRVNPTTGIIDSSWFPTINGTGWGVAKSKIDDTVYIAGFFDGVNGLATDRGFVGVNNIGATVVHRDVLPYNGCNAAGYCSQMYDVETTSTGLVFIAGVEHSLYVLDATQNHDLAWHHYSGCDPSRNAQCLPVNWIGGEWQELESSGDRVYATCHCFYDMFSDTQVQPHTAPTGTHATIDTIAAFDSATGDHLPEFRVYLSGTSGGFGIHTNESDGCIWIVGGLSAYGPPTGSHPAARDVVRVCDTAGPGPTAQPAVEPPPVLSCTGALTGSDMNLSWGVPEGASSVIIERSVDNGNWFWRANLDNSTSTFTEAIPFDIDVSYRAKVKYEAFQVSAPTDCGQTVSRPNDSVAPASCSVAVVGTDANVDWSAVTGASSYIVYRTVDGGSSFWRGAVAAPTLTFTDDLGAGPVYLYQLAAKNDDGFLSPRTDCAPTVSIPADDITAVASCSTSVSGSDALLQWESSTNAAAYLVHRSVNGGTAHWRGRVDHPGTTFSDPIFSNVTFRYTVTAKAEDGTTSQAVPCTPDVEIFDQVLAPPSQCSVLLTGSDAVVTWTPSLDAGTTIVSRSRDGNTHWRGRVDNGGATFTDTVDSGDFTYSVVTKSDTGDKSVSVDCT